MKWQQSREKRKHKDSGLIQIDYFVLCSSEQYLGFVKQSVFENHVFVPFTLRSALFFKLNGNILLLILSQLYS